MHDCRSFLGNFLGGFGTAAAGRRSSGSINASARAVDNISQDQRRRRVAAALAAAGTGGVATKRVDTLLKAFSEPAQDISEVQAEERQATVNNLLVKSASLMRDGGYFVSADIGVEVKGTVGGGELEGTPVLGNGETPHLMNGGAVSSRGIPRRGSSGLALPPVQT